MKKKYILWIALFFNVSVSFAAVKSFEFNFWTSQATESDKRVLRLDAHPCGEVAVARLSQLPKYSKQSGLIPERVFELNQSGKILKQWSIPIDSDLRAIQGDALYLDLHQKSYRIALNRRVTLAKNPPKRTKPQVVQCTSPFPLSSDGECLAHKDAITGKTRILYYETVCS
jgi:hypothetical protein